MLLKIILTVLLSQSIKCSLVIDKTVQTGIKYSDYCPKIGSCAEGAHVMCMYYNPKLTFGPHCNSPKRNVIMTPAVVNQLLDFVNGVRSKLAKGTEKGKDGAALPRGYGLFRLKWDPTLATFAQVFANQCILNYDLCRATKQFSDPGQTTGIGRFTYPDWLSINRVNLNEPKGLTNATVTRAITMVTQGWYVQKNYVTSEMITKLPNWTGEPAHNKMQGYPFLTMIHGSATHMGCGVSAYNEYVYVTDARSLSVYNSIQVVCNFSARPRTGTAVYSKVPPKGTTKTVNPCGCPANSLEDDDCLCHKVVWPTAKPLTITQKGRVCPGIECQPTVVLLPIFDVEDAPPDMLIDKKSFSKTSLGQLERLEQNMKSIQHHTSADSKDLRQSPALRRKNSISVRVKHVEKGVNQLKNQNSKTHNKDGAPKYMQTHTQRESIFVKAPIFELSKPRNFSSTSKKTVIPRKDFSTGKKLVGKYLYGKNGLIPNPINNLATARSDEMDNNLHNYLHPKVYNQMADKDEDFVDIITTENYFNTTKHLFINPKDNTIFLNTTHGYGKLLNKNVKETNDNKLMAILDTLEQKVRHVELRDDERKMFEAKIKKIYGKVVGKPLHTLDGDDEHDKTLEDVNEANILDPRDIQKYENNLIDHLTYHNKHENDPNNVDNHDNDNNHDFSKKANSKRYKLDANIIKPTIRRTKTNLNEISHNEMNSIEYDRRRYENEKRRKSKNHLRNLRNDFKIPKHPSKGIDHRYRDNYYENDPWYDDPLSAERRKYYQEQFDKIERRLQSARRPNHRKVTPKTHMRAMRPSVSGNHMNPIYNSRARFLHGY